MILPIYESLLLHSYYNPRHAGRRTVLLDQIPARRSVFMNNEKTGYGLCLDVSRNTTKQALSLSFLLLVVSLILALFFMVQEVNRLYRSDSATAMLLIIGTTSILLIIVQLILTLRQTVKETRFGLNNPIPGETARSGDSHTPGGLKRVTWTNVSQ